MQSRFQADILNLVKIQINPDLTPYTFSLVNKLLNNKNSVLILSNNINKLLGIRQQGGVFTYISGQNGKYSGYNRVGSNKTRQVELDSNQRVKYLDIYYYSISKCKVENNNRYYLSII